MKNTNKTTHWDSVASWYDDLVGQEGSDFQKNIIFPGVIKMFDNSADNKMKVLDLACGQGVFCRYLFNKKIDVLGIDMAESLIKIAKERNPKIPYITADVLELLDNNGNLRYDLKENTYNHITILLAIQNIAKLSFLWTVCHKLLKTNGSLIIVMMHPCFRIPKHADWIWNNSLNRQERVMWKYYKSSEILITTHPGEKAYGKESTETIHFHRPLQSYFNTLGSAGLLVDHLEEWVSNKKEQKGIKSRAIENAKEEFPMFLAIRARKI